MNLPMRPVTHRVIGREDHVVNVLHAAHARGHLLDHHSPHRLDDGRVSITITVLQPVLVPDPVPAGRACRRLLLAVKILAALVGTAVLASVGWGVWLLLAWIHAHPLLLIGVVVVAVALAGAVSATTTHRRGCGHP
jgi:hypothetical protein